MLSFLSKLNFLAIAFLILAVAGGGAGYYYYTLNQKLTQNPNLAVREETQRIINAVGKLIELPKDEQPTIATISDEARLKDQPFFANAKNGDKILIYTKAKKAILYRPSINKIIEVAPVNLGNTADTAKPAKVALYNGTTTVGLTNQIEDKIKNIANIKVTDKSNASKNTYETTTVVDLSGNHAKEAKEIADILNGTVGSLPIGEAKPEADILVIIGTETEKASPTPAPKK